MRYINIEDKTPPEEWCRKADELTRDLIKLDSPEERTKFIKRHKIWKDLKEWLLELSHGKCWYSESKEIFSFYDVDHFRPKSRATQLDGTEREGYWWLAFDWRNYRISGSIGNRPHQGEDNKIRGKADYFPLKKGSPEATDHNCDLCDEIIYLLDPTDPDDPPLLTFDESGYPKPAVPEGTWECERAKVTIELMHLDFRPLVDERKKKWTKCILLITRAQKLMEEQSKASSATKRAVLKFTLEELRKMSSEEVALSSTARACLLSSGLSWARNIV
jgi:uncharacterized protein (TIGR02646 family)